MTGGMAEEFFTRIRASVFLAGGKGSDAKIAGAGNSARGGEEARVTPRQPGWQRESVAHEPYFALQKRARTLAWREFFMFDGGRAIVLAKRVGKWVFVA